MATSVPVPIAMPRSAWASAAASLTPSPTIATRRPSPCRSATAATLSAGSTSAITSGGVDADLGGDRGGGGRVVTGEQHGPQAQPAEFGDRLGAGGFHGVGDDQQAADSAVPTDPDDRPAGRLRDPLGLFQLGVRCCAHSWASQDTRPAATA